VLSSRFSPILHVLLTGILLNVASLSAGRAEVILHGASTALPGPAITVNGNVGQTKTGSTGNNLFHSFSVFNILPAGPSASGRVVPAQESVTFTPPSVGGVNVPIANVISRVTGGTSAFTLQKSSLIDGQLNSSIPGANFWFINPNGIIFGNNARLNVGGSFHASTADYIKLADGNIFAATPSSSEVLTVAPPSAFGFLKANPAGIQVGTQNLNNILAVPVGRTLSLVGGTIDIGRPNGTAPGLVLAPAGRVNLVSVASAGEATFDPSRISGSLAQGVPTDRDINVDNFTQLGTINIVGGRLGATLFGSVVDGKEIFIRSGQLVVNHGVVNPGFFAERNAPFPPADGGQIRVKTSGDVTITGTVPVFGLDSGIHARAGSVAGLPSPRDTPNIIVESGGKVTVGTPQEGRATVRSDRFTGNTANPASFGNVTIKADRLEVAGGGQISTNNFFSDFFGGPGRGGNLTVDAREVVLSGEGASRFTGLSTQSTFHTAYPEQSTSPLLTTAGGGKLTVNADTLTMKKGANISSDSFAFGPSGDIEINVGDMFLSRDGAATGSIAAQSTLAGKAGNISINATGQIEINEALISATSGGSGDGGSANVTAGKSISVSGKDAGIISLTAPPPRALLDEFAQVVSPFFQTRFGVATPNFAALVAAIERQGVDLPDNAGWIDVLQALNKAPFSVTAVADVTPGNGGQISVTTPSLVMNVGTRIDSSTLWDGNAGQVTGNVGSLTLKDGAQIRSQSGGVAVDTQQPSVGLGQGGDVTLTVADSLSITGSNSAVSTNTFGNGDGGSIFLTAGKLVNIQNGGRVSADSGGTLAGQQFSGSGLAGNINISAGDQIAMTSGSVSTRAVTSDGGNIIVNAPRMIQLTDSQITTSVESGFGGGGNINIDPQFLILNNSQILANAFGGPGGNINITADVFLVNSGGRFPTSLAGIVDASSALSTPGTVNIEATFTNVTGTFAQLPSTPLQATELLRASCAARFAGGKASSLVIAGRDGLPLQPGDLLPSPLYVAGLSSGDNKSTAEEKPLRFSFLESKGRPLNKYSLLPNAKCSL
jgi:filamentous hemagglutinin family protein